jgi:hypothetical protein
VIVVAGKVGGGAGIVITVVVVVGIVTVITWELGPTTVLGTTVTVEVVVTVVIGDMATTVVVCGSEPEAEMSKVGGSHTALRLMHTVKWFAMSLHMYLTPSGQS